MMLSVQREHASNVGISTHLETAAGYLMEKLNLSVVLLTTHKPVVAILGGAKVSDKIGVIKT